jgi:preprotein translocase subunit SecF
MEFFKQNTSINFMALHKWAMCLSALIALLCILTLSIKGLNWGLEFTGGTEVIAAFPQAENLETVRSTLEQAGYKDVKVQIYGTAKVVLIRLGGKQENMENNDIGKEVVAHLNGATLQSTDYIGPQVGKELATNGALALVLAMLGTAIYIAFRFEYRFAISAAVALIHDPLIILGIFSYFQMEFDLTSLAALLTVMGYSLNDTIVVFDRIRENFRKSRKGTPTEIVNLSVNQTLSRTIMTSGLTLLAVLSLFLFGGETLHGFATAMVAGIVVGTYSSIYVAGALAVALGLNRQDLLPPSRDTVDNTP